MNNARFSERMDGLDIMKISEFKPIDSVGAFLRAVKHFYPDGERAFFRGQSDSEYDVCSSFYRLLRINEYERHAENYSYMLANELFSEFKKFMPAFEEVHTLKRYQLNDLDLMMVAQHYGLKTRLIDWSKSPLVALYFATEAAHPERNCSVYMLYNTDGTKVVVTSSEAFSKSVIDEQKRILALENFFRLRTGQDVGIELLEEVNAIINMASSNTFLSAPIGIHPDIRAYDAIKLCAIAQGKSCKGFHSIFEKGIVNALAPISGVKIVSHCHYIIEALPINPRIKNQQGVLLFSNYLDKPVFANSIFSDRVIVSSDAMEDLHQKDKSRGTVRIDIPGKFAKEIHRELNLYGISRDFIYPEITSFTQVMQDQVVAKMTRSFHESKSARL